jgi:hypothetical protein
MNPSCKRCGYSGTLMYWSFGRYVCFGCRRVLVQQSNEEKTR